MQGVTSYEEIRMSPQERADIDRRTNGMRHRREIDERVVYEPLTELLNRIENRTARIVVIGQGYVGLPVAMEATEQGFDVVGYEVDAKRAESLAAGVSYVEDIDGERLRTALAGGYRVSTELGDLAGFDVAIITVPTPLTDGVPDLSYVGSAGEALARVLRSGALVVLESTTYPGTTNEYLAGILEKSGLRAGADFFLGYSPERIDPGNPTWNLVNTPKVVAGCNENSARVADAFYSTIVQQTVLVDSCETAELVKILENTYRHVNIALVNELAMFAGQLGVDIWAAIDAADTKPFGFTAFRPGPGVGGHCLPIDPSYLSWRVRQDLGQTFRFVELANDVNQHMPDYVVRRISSMLNERERSVRGSKILLLGMTYKAGTSDWRESPSLVVAKRLKALGAQLTFCDPHLPDGQREALDAPFVDFGPEALEAADLVVVLVDHPEFDPEVISACAPVVFDTKSLVRGHDFAGEVL